MDGSNALTKENGERNGFLYFPQAEAAHLGWWQTSILDLDMTKLVNKSNHFLGIPLFKTING